jgi:cyclophilin family peptidyl-prolyl cis-trans isomerase
MPVRALPFVAVCLLLSLALPAAAQQAPAAKAKAPAANPKAPAAEGNAPATAGDFATQFAEWKALLARFAQIRTQYQTDAGADKPALQAEADKIAEKAREMMDPLTMAALKAYTAAPDKDPQVKDFLLGALNNYIATDDYETAVRVARILIDNKFDKPELDFLAGLAFFNTNDFDAAEQHLQAAKNKKVINQHGLRHLDMIPQYKELWAQEKQLREAEDKAGDLPKVKLTTTKGDIVVALFENEAPNTVANFINLVENKFYDGLTFHRVIPGFMAQGGDPKGDGSGGPGYTIPDECRQDNHRNHFRGSLSMAKTAAPDTGGSQFFINFTPTSHLDGKHTVFGKVIEGQRVLAKLERTEGVPGTQQEPDKILKATVLQKRPHEYKAVKRVDPTN